MDKITLLQDFRTGWFQDVLILDGYLLQRSGQFVSEAEISSTPTAVGNVRIRLQKKAGHLQFYVLRNLSQI